MECSFSRSVMEGSRWPKAYMVSDMLWRCGAAGAWSGIFQGGSKAAANGCGRDAQQAGAGLGAPGRGTEGADHARVPGPAGGAPAVKC